MPELPEVEAMRSLLHHHCAGRRISAVHARESGGGPRTGKFDGKVIAEGVTEDRFVRALQGREVAAAKRLGKQLWLELSGSGPHLLLHCGMTGSISVDGVERFSFQSFSVDEAWPPRFTKLQLVLAPPKGKSGAETRVAFSDPRRFGVILLRDDPLHQEPCRSLAPDPLVSKVSLQDFAAGLTRCRTPVKSVLLNQGRLVCGVGNWVADEVLHKAKVHPAALACTLSPQQAQAVFAALMHVLRVAVAVDADYDRFPKHWVFHRRWTLQGRSALTLPDGTPLAFDEVGGRTTVYTADQRMGELQAPAGARKPAARAAAPAKRRGKTTGSAPAAGGVGRRHGALPAAALASSSAARGVRKRPAAAVAAAGPAVKKRPAAAAFKVPLRGPGKHAVLDLT